MRLLQHTDPNRHIRQRTGAIANPTSLALIGETELLIHPGFAHLDLLNNGLGFSHDRFQGAGGAGIATFHTEDAGLLPGDDIGCVEPLQPDLGAEELNALIGADFGALATTNTTAEKLFFRQGARGPQETHDRAFKDKSRLRQRHPKQGADTGS